MVTQDIRPVPAVTVVDDGEAQESVRPSLTQRQDG